MVQAAVKVGELATQIRGVTYEKTDASPTPQPGYLPVLRAGNITDAGLTFEDLVFVPAARVSDKQKVRRHDVVIAASSGSLDVVGKAAPALGDFEGGFGAFCKVLRPNRKVDPSYFAHFFKTQDYRRRISALAAGININNLRSAHLDELQIPLPPLAEQRRIAAVLDQAEALRAKRRATLALLDSLTKAIFLEMFGDPGTKPKSWPRLTLDELIETGPQNGLYKPASDYGSGTRIVRIDAFYDGVVTELAQLKRVRVSAAERAVYALREGDIIVNRVNSMEYLGKSAIVPALDEPTVFESNMMRFSVRGELILPRYAVECLQTASVKRQILKAAKHAVNQSSINQKDVRSFELNVPPLPLQREFARRVAAVETLKAAHRASLAQMDALFASLQHRAFRGEL